MKILPEEQSGFRPNCSTTDMMFVIPSSGQYSLTSHKWSELVSFGRLVCRCHGVFSLVLRLFCFAFVFRLYAFVEAAALRSIVLRYPGVPIATRVSFFSFFPFFLVYLEMSLFPSIFSAISLYGKYVVRSFLPDGVFSTL